MNRKQQSVVLASLLALALAGCESTRGSSDTTTGSMGSGGGMASGGTAGSSGGSTAQTPQTPPAAGGALAPQATPQATPNAIVVAIDLVPSPSEAGGTAMGASGTAGTTGASPGGRQLYRITLKMDDGTTRIVTSDKAPGFRNGDRVNLTEGMITQ